MLPEKDRQNAARTLGPARPCPICGRPAVEKERPFCSRRCADVDLHRWLGGVYAIPAGEAADESSPRSGADDDAT